MKPKIFVGSSVEALDVAYAIQENLEFDATVTVWNQGIFELSSNALDDLINALGNFDFGIFVFKPDDITFMRSDKKNTVRDNVIFELGLFIGRLGKEKVFYVTPRNSSSFHLPTDLLGVNAGQYEMNRDDGNLKAALGTFCSQVRQKLKNFVYTNLNDLQNESKEAKKIAIEKPYGWEFLLAAELLSSKLVDINQSYSELEKGLVFSRTKRYAIEAYHEWFKESLNDIKKLILIFPNILKELNSSFGPPGVPGNILDIKRAVDRIISFEKELLAWEYRVNETDPPAELEEIKVIMSGWSKVIIDTINTMPNEIRRIIESSKINGSTNEGINFVFEAPKDSNKVVEIFKKYYEKQ
ncbi:MULTISPECIES: nucleotide-binding protein [unclassified Chitinophaga]|uniref:nucleotide-binding protein n=1 Tax=unclassified Chitinophaga TaxID=2619133 RepID=UPI003010495F